jgi:membrane protein
MNDRPLARRSGAGAPVSVTRRVVAGVSRAVRGSWLEELFAKLKAVAFGDVIVVMGATLVLSALPLLILVSSLANHRIEDDLSRHIGLDARGARIVEGLFRTSSAHSAGSVALGIIVAFAGTTAFVGSLQAVYEKVFGVEPYGWRHLPRFVAWLAVLVGALIGRAAVEKPLRADLGVVAEDAATLILVLVFFWWTMHFLLGGRVAWRRLIRPAVATALLWLCFALFSSVYFSSAVISENKLYGTVGVLFILVTWFIAVAAVLVLGACTGAVWESRRGTAG